MDSYVLLPFEHEKDVTIIITFHRLLAFGLQIYAKFDNDSEITFMFKM